MTLVYGTPHHDSLQQVQIGPVDIVSTIAAANTAWGWVGGFTGIARILRYGRGYLGSRAGTKVFGPLRLDPGTCNVLTYNGIVTFQDQVTAEAFGGDPSTQMLGVTMCALAYQMTNSACVEQFMTYLAPGLLRGEVGRLEGLKEALHRELVDNLAPILNEGAARGLTDRFARAIRSLGFSGSEGNFPRYEAWGEDRASWPSEWYLIGGFLKWLGCGAEGTYPTRSALVVKVAACLREVGFRIGFIRTWDGVSPRPRTSGSGVLLVVGGTSKTDPLVDENTQQIRDFIFATHYRYATTGAMILDSLQAECAVPVEVAQQYFENVDSIVREELDFEWRVLDEDPSFPSIEPYAFPQWKQQHRSSSRVAVRLAALHFPQSAQVLAHFYALIDDEHTFSVIQRQINGDSRKEPLPTELLRYRILTMSICLAIIGCAAGKDYHRKQHCTELHIRFPRALRNLAENVDRLANNCLLFGDVALLIGAIHCGTPIGIVGGQARRDEETDYKYNPAAIIGYRNGIYAVLPRLLFSLASGPSTMSLGFQCADQYLANIPTGKDGMIRSYGHGTTIRSGKSQRLFHGLGMSSVPSDEETQVSHTGRNVFLGAPRPCLPDKPLYMNIERPVDFSEPLLGLCGRINGEAIGNVGVPQILRNMIRSFEGQADDTVEPCPRHSIVSSASGNTYGSMFNVPPSVWAASSLEKPTADPDVYTYIPVLGDSAWALFIAGETPCRFSMGCAWCAAETGKEVDLGDREKVLVIGFR
ncbi:MAG: hypothetical protein Q9218_003722 [Villophora microphyllina]